MSDEFPTELSDVSPATHGVAVTPDDSNDLAHVTRALYVGSVGDVTVVMKDGDTVTFTAMAGGQIYPLRIKRVKATGTTATQLVGLW